MPLPRLSGHWHHHPGRPAGTGAGNTRMADGNQALRRALTSDANGTATGKRPQRVDIDWACSACRHQPGNTIVGTTDARAWVGFRTGNAMAGQLSNTEAEVVAFGLGSGLGGSRNTFMGANSGAAITTGFDNVALGHTAGAALPPHELPRRWVGQAGQATMDPMAPP
ncbi:MAG: hypothetical protein IPK99_05215 [Flavobacteriales bacterium]|nr:hypothetical protein [Flavobacteriales bacterium]